MCAIYQRSLKKIGDQRIEFLKSSSLTKFRGSSQKQIINPAADASGKGWAMKKSNWKVGKNPI